MRKRLLSLLLVTTMAFSLTACGGTKSTSGNAEGETATNTAASKEAASADSEKEDALTVWCWDPNFNIYAVNEAASIYQKEHPNFKIEVVDTSDIVPKLTTIAASGDYSSLPDIFLCPDESFKKLVKSYPDMFTDLSSSSINFKDFSASKLAMSVVDNKNYGVPFDNGAAVSCLRTDILEKAGYTIDDFTDITWSEFIEKGKVVLEKTGVPMLTSISGWPDLVMMMMQSAGASAFDQDGNPTIENNEVLVEVMKTYAELIKSGVAVQVNDADQYYGALSSGSTVGVINGCWVLGTVQAAKDQSGKWAITNMPKLDNVANATNYSSNGGSSWAISSNCKDVKLAEDFLRSTFGGSVELYENILPKTGALASYLPAGKSSVYAEPQEFFGGDSIFVKIVDYSSKAPNNIVGVYHAEARDAIATALTNILGGADINSELKNAQDTVTFAMGQ